MSTKTGIEWTDATWNPVTGCTKVSQGCKNCYAKRDWARLAAMPNNVYSGREFEQVACHPERLDQPRHWRNPRRVFVNSMSDLFHEDVPDEFVDDVFAVMGACEEEQRWHIFQILTKRPERMREYMRTRAHSAYNKRRLGRELFPPRNVWLGVSVEDQATADERIPLLLQTPAAVRWISAEPLLGHIDLKKLAPAGYPYELDAIDPESNDGTYYERTWLDWVVVGGESGQNARPMHPVWAHGIRKQCAAANIPFFFKQWGEFQPVAPVYGCGDEQARIADADENRCVIVDAQGAQWPEFQPPEGSWVMERVGKKAAGRILDGRTWDEYPT